MADSSSRNIAGARRVPSAALSEDYYAFVRSGGNGGAAGTGGAYQHGPQHSLRPMESRFSLREQFSTTRREIEFGFDDTSSIFERSTVASGVEPDNELEDTVLVNEASSFMPPPPRPSHDPPIQRSHYELLCLPNDSSLTPNDIRRAFHRVVQNLCVDRQPQRLQPAAASYLGQVQVAFETLIEPYKRAEYDNSRESHSEIDQDAAAYQASVLEQYVLLGPGSLRTTTDIGMRVDARSIFDNAARKDKPSSPGIMDLSLRQSITTNLPALQEPLENAITAIRDMAERTLDLSPSQKHTILRVNPTMTITGSTHGLLDEPFKLAAVLRHPYQPPGPSIHGRRRLEQLLTSRFLPGLNLTTRQEFFLHDGSGAIPDSVLEQELEILPFPSVTLRAGHSLVLPQAPTEPLNIEVSVQKPLITASSSSSSYFPTAATSPSIGLAIDKKLSSGGTVFFVLDGGSPSSWGWTAAAEGDMPAECRELSRFSDMTSSPSTGPGRFTSIQKLSTANNFSSSAFRNAPTIEIGYAFASGQHPSASAMGLRSSSDRAFTRPSERGLRGLDRDVSLYGADSESGSSPSWTVSTGLTYGTVAGYLRYGRDFFTSTASSSSQKAAPKICPGKGTSRNIPMIPVKKSGFRAEVELSAAATSSISTALPRISSFAFRKGSNESGDLLLAFRTLKYIGRFTKIGLELGITARNMHLSIYWSRLGQRVSIPFLMLTFGIPGSSAFGSNRSTGNLVFWTSVVPFAALAVWDGFLGRVWRSRLRKKNLKKSSSKKANSSKGGESNSTKEGDENKGSIKEEGLLRKESTGKKRERVVSLTGASATNLASGSVEELLVAKQRAEADDLTAILATGVEGRQRAEKQRGGLVILSAKYGVLAGLGQPQPQIVAGEENEEEHEIADVTVAVAAIVDEEGRLNIPAWLEKGRLLGFWDPAPSLRGKKTLWVKYLYRGKESVVEVGEGEGLFLP